MTGPTEPKRSRRLLTDISVATRLSLVALIVTLLSLVAAATVGLWRGSTLAEGLIEDRVTSVTDSRASAVELFIGSIQRQVGSLAASPGAIDAIDRLADAYRALERSAPTDDQRSTLAEYYLTEVVPGLDRVRSTAVGASTLVPVSDAAVQLQSLYTVPRAVGEDGPLIAPALVSDARDGSEYSAVHAEVHPVYAEITTRSDFDDLYLIAADRDTIVYSTRKRIDFATSLDVGPWSGSALSSLIDTLAEDPTAGSVVISDMAPYGPVFDRPTTFVATRVEDDDRLVGFVAVAVPFSDLDAILSGSGQWDGFGESGESFLVGADGTMRTTARPFAASSSQFLASASDQGPSALTADQRRRMATTGTTALVQDVDIDLVRRASDGADTIETTGYRGERVLAAYRPLGIPGLDWVLITQVTADELDDPIEDYARNMLLAMALFVVAVTFAAVRWSGRVMAPIRMIAARLRAVRVRDAAASEPGGSLPPGSPTEYVELADNIDEMLRRLDERRAAVESRSAERADLLRRFLPAAIAQRSEQTGGEVLDHVANASVVVLVVEGLGDLLASREGHVAHDLLAATVDEIDALSVDLGLDRIKVTGDRYYAVCGASRPHLDHAPRAVGFALAAVELVGELAREQGLEVVVRGGVDAGSVSVGLADRSGLVYDSWGPAVSGASELARSAPSGRVAVSSAVRRQLPDEFVLAGDAPADGPAVVVRQLVPSEELR